MQVLLSAEIRDKTVFNATWSITNKSVGHLPIWLLTGSFYTLILSDKGVRILGERSGGGSCSVQSNSTADGWIYAISNNIHLINAAGEDIDAGVPVSAELVTVGEDGTRDYSAFYDFERIREGIR